MELIKGKIEQLSDSLNNVYLGVVVYPKTVERYCQEMFSILGDQEIIQIYIQKRFERDGDNLHMTIFAPQEFNKLSPFDIDTLITQEVEANMIGLGRLSHNTDDAFFVVCQSQKIQEIRKNHSLAENYLHITLGFKQNDIHSLKKDATTLVSLDN